MMASAIFAGRVHHARLTPRRHRLSYRLFMLFVDLDELDLLDRRLRLFSRNRFNLVSFHDSDFGDGSGRPLRGQLEALLTGASIPLPGAIRVLCMPRVLGHAFRPLTMFFCYHPDGGLAAIVYEVSNTFGGRQSYVLPVSVSMGPVDQCCAKSFFVSPFMELDLRYVFEVSPPEDVVRVAISVFDDGGPVMNAAFNGGRRELSDTSLLAVWASHPLQSLGVLAVIYWEGLKLLLKGFRWRPPPALHTRAGAKRMAATRRTATCPQPIKGFFETPAFDNKEA